MSTDRTTGAGGGRWVRRGGRIVVLPSASPGSELEGEEEFLDTLGSWARKAGDLLRLGSGETCTIQDRTHLTDKKKRIKSKRIGPYALVLHQMAFSRGSDVTKYDNVTSHYAILPDGALLRLHPDSAYLSASNGFNAGSVAVEFAGNFPNTKGKCWEAKKFGCHAVTAEQVRAGRCLVRHLVKAIGLTHVLAHRQSSNMRENDPGPDLWYNVGEWAIKTLGLKDGGPGFEVGSGNPIPDEWRTWGRSPPGI